MYASCTPRSYRCMPSVAIVRTGRLICASIIRLTALRSVPITAGTGVPITAIKRASIFSAHRQIFFTRSLSRPITASISLSPAEKTADFLLDHLGSSNPQIFPAQPPASRMTMIPPSS